jgi:hypothetical protein
MAYSDQIQHLRWARKQLHRCRRDIKSMRARHGRLFSFPKSFEHTKSNQIQTTTKTKHVKKSVTKNNGTTKSWRTSSRSTQESNQKDHQLH